MLDKTSPTAHVAGDAVDEAAQVPAPDDAAPDHGEDQGAADGGDAEDVLADIPEIARLLTNLDPNALRAAIAEVVAKGFDSNSTGAGSLASGALSAEAIARYPRLGWLRDRRDTHRGAIERARTVRPDLEREVARYDAIVRDETVRRKEWEACRVEAVDRGDRERLTEANLQLQTSDQMLAVNVPKLDAARASLDGNIRTETDAREGLSDAESQIARAASIYAAKDRLASATLLAALALDDLRLLLHGPDHRPQLNWHASPYGFGFADSVRGRDVIVSFLNVLLHALGGPTGTIVERLPSGAFDAVVEFHLGPLPEVLDDPVEVTVARGHTVQFGGRKYGPGSIITVERTEVARLVRLGAIDDPGPDGSEQWSAMTADQAVPGQPYVETVGGAGMGPSARIKAQRPGPEPLDVAALDDPDRRVWEAFRTALQRDCATAWGILRELKPIEIGAAKLVVLAPNLITAAEIRNGHEFDLRRAANFRDVEVFPKSA